MSSSPYTEQIVSYVLSHPACCKMDVVKHIRHGNVSLGKLYAVVTTQIRQGHLVAVCGGKAMLGGPGRLMGGDTMRTKVYSLAPAPDGPNRTYGPSNAYRLYADEGAKHSVRRGYDPESPVGIVLRRADALGLLASDAAAPLMDWMSDQGFPDWT